MSIETTKKRRDGFRRNGLCYICGRPPAAGKKSCSRCLKQQVNRTHRLRQKCATQSLCMYCVRPLPDGSTLYSCRACRVRRKRYGATVPNRFSRARSQRVRQGQIWTLTLAEYTAIVALPCAYCLLLNSTEQACGLDRIDNRRGYTTDNVVSCCAICNMVRNDIFTPQEMKQLGHVIRQIKQKREIRFQPNTGTRSHTNRRQKW